MAAAVVVLLTSMWLYLIGGRVLKLVWKLTLQSVGKPKLPVPVQPLKKLILHDPFALILERLRLFETLQLQLSSYHMKLIILNGSDWTIERTKADIAASIGNGYAALMGCAWLSLLAKEPLLLMMGLVFGIVLSIRQVIDARRRVEQRKWQMITELPDMLSKLMLLVGAGETVNHALTRCLERKDTDSHPLYKEWSDTVAMIRNGQPFSYAIERFNRRCAVQEVSIFTTVLLLNYRRGGEHFVLALRELSYTLWEKRKAIARARGEEASSKLVFPLVGILLVLMILVAAPAVLLMS